MALTYLSCDRDQPFLLPPDLRDWLTKSHLVWLVLDLIEELDTTAFHSRAQLGGAGRAPYDPEMLLGLLVYAYCVGQRSSRQIERLCEVDVAFRVLTTNRVPDHTTIARFRKDFEAEISSLFSDVLEACRRHGLAKVGTVALDGTKMAGNASRSATHTRADIEAEVERIMKDAEELDAEEDRLYGNARGDEMPPDLLDPRTRRVRLAECLRQMEQERSETREKAEADIAERTRRRIEKAKGERVMRAPKERTRAPSATQARADLEVTRAKVDAIQERRRSIEERAQARGEQVKGPSPNTKRLQDAMARVEATLATAEAKEWETAQSAEANTTDPDSRLMKTRDGYLQGYNAQAVVSEDQLIVAAQVANQAADSKQYQPMVQAAERNLEASARTNSAGIGIVLADAGYWSTNNAAAKGPDRLIATAKGWKLRRRARDGPRPSGPPPEDATPLEAMEHRLLTEEGDSLYRRRSIIVEPVFGQIKEGRSFRRFMRRGLVAADCEWKLIALTHNILKLHRFRIATI